ncbi:MAG: type II secretion system protein [Phycisphaerae bacterium]
MSSLLCRSHPRRNSGFTLIELLVVIAIVSLLVTILIPALGVVQEEARVTKCLTNLKGIGLAINMYSNANKSIIVPALVGDAGGADLTEDVRHTDAWDTVLVNDGHIDSVKSDDIDKIASGSGGTPFMCPSGVRETSTVADGAWHGSPQDKMWQTGVAHVSKSTDETYYIHNWYGASADTYYLERFPFCKDVRDNDGSETPRYNRMSDLERTSDVAGIYDGWNIHRGWGWYTIAGRHGAERNRTNVMSMDGSCRNFHRAALPMQQFQKGGHISARNLTRDYPGLLWRSDQWN